MRLIASCILLLAGPALAQSSNVVDAGGPGFVRAATSDSNERTTWIVQMARPSAAESFAVPRKSAAADKTVQSFSKSRPGVEAYAAELVAAQDRLLARYAPAARKTHSYQFSINGFAASLTAAEADKLRSRPDVVNVWQDEIRTLTTDSSPQFLRLFDNDEGLRGPRGLTGENIVVGFIDSGIYPEHPQLRDTVEAARPSACRSSWGRNSLLGQWLCGRYDDREDRLVYEPPEDWSGECESGERFTTELCNNKLIGARFFVDGAEATGELDDGEFRSARDVDGHGTHTATTAAGNRETADIFGSFVGTVEGIAPRARVAAYKACWLRPETTRATCNTSDLVDAIDAAVADGVDIISYSVGSSVLDITAPDDIALTNATRAGVLAVVAAGNDGPVLNTVGSPAGNPFVITAAASTRDGTTSREAARVANPPSVAGRYAVREASFTPALAQIGPIEANLVLVDDDDTASTDDRGTTQDGCQPLVNAADIDGRIAFVERGGCEFEVKVRNAEGAGALAVLVFNVAGAPIVMNGNGDGIQIPALMIGQADGNLLLAELEAGVTVEVVLDKGLLLQESETGNRMAQFSSRGPGAALGILKPDVTAPGVNILAGISPDAANTRGGEQWGYLSGTSMSTPHISGAAALLLEANPGWTPDVLKSVLMTSARQDVVRGTGDAPANPFDFGAGHIEPNAAFSAGLAYEIVNDEFDAFACAAELPEPSPERCTVLVNSGQSLRPEDLNLPSIAVPELAARQTVTRRLTNLTDATQTVNATLTPPPGMDLSVAPPSLSLAPGATAEYALTLNYIDGPLDLWRFGGLTWENDELRVYSPLAARPVPLSTPDFIEGSGGTGSVDFDVNFGYTGSYQAGLHGLNAPTVIDGFVDNDPTQTFSFRDGDGVTIHLVDVAPDQLYLRFALFNEFTDGNDDLDIYVYFCPDTVNCNRIGESGAFDSTEEFNVVFPASGRYAVLVHGFETDEVQGGPGANYSLFAWSFGRVDDQGNMSIAAPSFVNAGTTETLSLSWSGLTTNTIYVGGLSHTTPQGLSALTIIRVIN